MVLNEIKYYQDCGPSIVILHDKVKMLDSSMATAVDDSCNFKKILGKYHVYDVFITIVKV